MTAIDYRDLPARDGFDLRAELFYDPDVSVRDYDCYTPRQIEAFDRGDWDYCGIVVTASLDGRNLGSASIWGCEHGLYPITTEDDTITKTIWIDPLTGDSWDQYGDDLVSEAIAEAQAFLARATLKGVAK